MVISRKGFLKSFLAVAAGLWGSGLSGKEKLFAQADIAGDQEKMYKVGDKVPRAGRYQCVVCGLIVEYLPRHIEKGAAFGICTLCKAGTESGPKKPDEGFWKYAGACG